MGSLPSLGIAGSAGRMKQGGWVADSPGIHRCSRGLASVKAITVHLLQTGTAARKWRSLPVLVAPDDRSESSVYTVYHLKSPVSRVVLLGYGVTRDLSASPPISARESKS